MKSRRSKSSKQCSRLIKSLQSSPPVKKLCHTLLNLLPGTSHEIKTHQVLGNHRAWPPDSAFIPERNKILPALLNEIWSSRHSAILEVFVNDEFQVCVQHLFQGATRSLSQLSYSFFSLQGQVHVSSYISIRLDDYCPWGNFALLDIFRKPKHKSCNVKVKLTSFISVPPNPLKDR